MIRANLRREIKVGRQEGRTKLSALSKQSSCLTTIASP